MTGCATFKSEPIDPEVSAGDWSERTLSDVGLQSFVTEIGGISKESWPPQSWDLDSLTLAGLYFQPDLELAQAAFEVVDSGREVAAQRPNPTLWVVPAYNSTSSIPTPWILTGYLYIPIETAGKRKFRIAQSQHLSDAARFRMATAAWKIRGDVRRTFLALWIALGVEQAREIQYHANEKNCSTSSVQTPGG
jgi:outer membrane protein TolC